MTLKVPYNFVPLNEKVVRPYWIDHISHDVPFKDGKSGTLKLTLTAESPIFVRQGGPKPIKGSADENKVHDFQVGADGSCILPGSSLRGMVRSVLETLSFGRMIGRVSERRYALRDLTGAMADDYLAYFQDEKDPVQCGWLSKEGHRYFIESCGKPGRISHQAIRDHTGIDFVKEFHCKSETDDLRIAANKKSAKYKYSKFGPYDKAKFVKDDYCFVKSKEEPPTPGKNMPEDRYQFAPQSQPDLGTPGRLVFTGQPMPRNEYRDPASGKYLEFIFFKSNLGIKLEVSEEVMEDFKFAYFDHRPEKSQSDDYKWRKKQLADENENPIPVFFKAKGFSNGRPVGVQHLGLSYLYKLPYDYSVEESIKNFQKCANLPDLADAIFGVVDEGEKSRTNLKGRVQFSHAKSETKPGSTVHKTILSEPKASFYPTYVRQPDVKDNGKLPGYKYETLLKKSATIAGRKRYPVIEDSAHRKTRSPKKKNDSIWNSFKPLPKGTTFECDVNYHNLREIELGALISAITFHNSTKARHQVGLAKPYGFGKVKIDIELTDKKLNAEDLMTRFEAYMDSEMPTGQKWYDTNEVRELLSLTVPVDRKEVDTLRGDYPYNELNDFRKVKGNKKYGIPGEALPLHSKMRRSSFEAGLSLEANKSARYKADIEADRRIFENLGVSDVVVIECKLREQLEIKVAHEITALQQRIKDIRRATEAQRTASIEARKQKEKEEKEQLADIARAESALRQAKKALENGPNYANVTIGRPREFFKKLATEVSRYLEEIAPVFTGNPTTGSMPDQWKEGLINKIKDVQQKQKKDWKKKLEQKRASATSWLGAEAAEELFDNLI